MASPRAGRMKGHVCTAPDTGPGAQNVRSQLLARIFPTWQGEVSNQEVAVALETQVSLYKGSADAMGTGRPSLASLGWVCPSGGVLIGETLSSSCLVTVYPWGSRQVSLVELMTHGSSDPSITPRSHCNQGSAGKTWEAALPIPRADRASASPLQGTAPRLSGALVPTCATARDRMPSLKGCPSSFLTTRLPRGHRLQWPRLSSQTRRWPLLGF